MKVRFAADVLAAPAAWLALDRIIDSLLREDGRHLWDADDPTAIEESLWVTSEPESRATRRNLEALQMMPMRALYTPATREHRMTITVSMLGSPPYTLAPEEALRCLSAPVYVVVEDADSDKAFLLAMVRAFTRDALQVAIDRCWCEAVHAGGGGGIPKRVRDLVAKMGPGPLRILVLSDSDRLKPDDPSRPDDKTDTIRKIEKCRDEHGVAIAILHKREIENYLPVGALQRVPRPKQPTYKAFLHLDDLQKDHYDMKEGFKLDEAGEPVVPDEQAQLFQHVPRKTLRALVGGFGKDIWRYFDSAAHVITMDAMRLTCTTNPQEIDRILDAIEGLL